MIGEDTLGLLSTAASGMEAQRAALDVAARNVAAAEAAGPTGSYERMVARFELTSDPQGNSRVRFAGAQVLHGSSVDMLTEMVSVLNASRAYQANAAIFDVGKQLAQKTIDMGRM